MARSPKRSAPTVRVICQTLDGDVLSSAEITLNRAVLRKNLKDTDLFRILSSAQEAAGNLVWDAFKILLQRKSGHGAA